MARKENDKWTFTCNDCSKNFIVPEGTVPEYAKISKGDFKKWICPECVKINPWSKIMQERYTNEGRKTIEEIAEIVDKIGKYLSVDDLVKLNMFLMERVDGDILLSTMLILKIVKLDRTRGCEYI